jgi:20S proteasome alpha/beta subunit
MAADTLITGDGLIHGTISKLARAKNGSIIGLCGSAFDLESFIEWYDGDRQQHWSASDGTEALVLSPDGIIRCFNHVGRSFICTAPQAIGSGAAVAYGALAMGASPNQAVQVAIKYDMRTGGNAESMMVMTRCEYCDGTGDVHRADGEWLGSCNCV